MVVNCTLRIRHIPFSFDFVGFRFVMVCADFWRDCETRLGQATAARAVGSGAMPPRITAAVC
jgi:hypothetical protein